MRGIGIAERRDDPRHARLDQQVGAGRAALAAVGAGLERDVGGGAARRLAGLGQRHRLGMGPAAGLGPAAADDDVRP